MSDRKEPRTYTNEEMGKYGAMFPPGTTHQVFVKMDIGSLHRWIDLDGVFCGPEKACQHSVGDTFDGRVIRAIDPKRGILFLDKEVK